jgi:hypothetical protein
MMTTKTMSSLEEAAGKLIDELERGTNVTLDVSLNTIHDAEAAMIGSLVKLMAAVHEEAMRRGVGISLRPTEGNALCVSLRRP